jgi:uncharacterized protein YifN (PemK superfamily)
MPVQFHPKQGCVVVVDFSGGFKEPEMVKRRLAIVLSKPIRRRPNIMTVVPLSTLEPQHPMPYHLFLDLGFDLPGAWRRKCWLKGDMVTSVAFHRVDLLRRKDGATGRRKYLDKPLDDFVFRDVQTAVMHGLGLSALTKHL